jgi:hypothetical protein
MIRELIVCVGSGSYGSGQLDVRGGGAGHRRPASAVARGSGSPDFTDSGAPVAYKARVCVTEGVRDMCNPPRALAGLGEARGRGCDGSGGSARRSSPAMRNRGRGATHRRRSSGGIPALHGSGS